MYVKILKRNSKMDNPCRVAFYRRVSSAGQVDADLSLPEQRVQQQAYASERGWVVAGEYEDAGISGKDAEAREQFMEMVAAAKHGEFTLILVWRKNRLLRNDDEAGYYGYILKKAGVTLHSITEPWVGGLSVGDRIAEHAMDVLAAQRLKEISEDTRRDLLKLARDQGRQNGSPPYGYRWKPFAENAVRRVKDRRRYDGWMTDTDAADVVRFLYDQYAFCGQKDVDLARVLNERGIPTASQSSGTGRHRQTVHPETGEPLALGWLASVIERILQNPVYLGKAKHTGELYDGHQEALVDAGTWQAAQTVRAGRARRSAEKSDGLFIGGMLRCPVCAEAGRDGWLKSDPYQVRLSGGATKRYAAYGCNIHNRARSCRAGGRRHPLDCPGFSISEKKVVALLSAHLARLTASLPKNFQLKKNLPDPEALFAAQSSRPKTSGREGELKLIERELAALPQQQDNYSQQQARGLISMDTLARVLESLREKREGLEAAKTLLDAQIAKENAATPGLSPVEAYSLLHVLQNDALPPAEKRDRLRLVIASLMPTADKHGLHIFRQK